MKKLLSIILVGYLFYFSIGLVIDYSIITSNPLYNKTSIQIEKPDQMKNIDFLNKLQEISTNLNTDIAHQSVSLINDQYHSTYYLTVNDDKFIPFLSKAKREKILKNDLLISKTLLGSHDYQSLIVMNNSNLEKKIYHIDNEKTDEWFESLVSENINVSKINKVAEISKMINYKTQLYPMIIIIFTILFFVINKRKESLIKRLNGYSSFNIIKDLIISQLKILLTISLICIILSFLFYILWFPEDYKAFLMFFTSRLIFINIVLFMLFLVIDMAIYFPVNALDLKGRVQYKQLFILSFSFKSLVFVIFVMYLSMSITSIFSLYDIHKTQIFLSNKLKNYFQVTINISANHITMDELIENADNERLFYDLTVDRFHGIIIDSGNYIPLPDGQTPADKFGEKNITINKNYLDINPIYDLEGNEISGDQFNIQEDTFHLLIPKRMQEEIEEIKENYINNFYDEYALSENKISITMYDDEKTNIYSYNSFISHNNGIIEAPIIQMFNMKYLGNEFGNYFGRSYFLYIDSTDPYLALIPYLTQTNLDHMVPFLNSVLSDFLQEFKNTRDKLFFILINMIINLGGLLVLLLYIIELYCINNRKKISIMRINGFRFLQIYNQYIIVQIAINIILLLLQLIFLNTNVLVFITFSIVEMILFFIITKKWEKINILEVMKEGI